ncbi:hypothetical protein pb186bvf_018861 [Paramecium bursaria]
MLWESFSNEFEELSHQKSIQKDESMRIQILSMKFVH